ncbi:flagellar MS-ring protein [Enterobacter hormaechei]|nr:flagellar MS-ring protein [Enterobacter hormaechei]
MANGQVSQFDITVNVQFTEHPIAIAVDRFRAEIQLFRNLIHLLTFSDHQHNLQFALRQTGKRRFRFFRFNLTQRHLLSNIRSDIALPCVNGADRIDDFLRRSAFTEIPRSPRLHDPGGQRIFGMDGQHDDFGINEHARDFARGFKPANTGRALDEGQISAVTHLVSSAVAGLPPGNVTLVDQSGHLLTQSNTAGRDLNDAQLKYAADVEGRLQRRIEAILGPVVGNSNVHAQVTAQIDFSNKEQTEEQYAPNGDASRAVLRSRQINETEQVGGQYPGGVPGALSNQPAPANAAPISTPPANPQNGQQTNQQTTSTANSAGPRNSSRNETTNYEVDRTIRHTKLNTGDIQRLSVAVVVNYKTLPDGKPLPLTAEQMKQIEDLTREAMGFSEKRGDTLNVVNSPFNPVDETGGELPFWQQQAFFDQLMSAGRWLLVLIVAWLLWRKGVRPQLQRRAEAEKAALEQKNARPDEEEAVEVRLSKDEQMQQRRANQRMGAEVMSQRIREMSDNDPRVVALVIRGWMGNEHE